MLNRIFPERIDNNYRGYKAAIWLFIPIVLMEVALSLAHMFAADGGAQSVSTIPLDTYSASAAQNIIAIMARLGLEQLLPALIFVVVLIRYRSMIPLMYLLIVLQYIALEGIMYMKPLALAETSGASTPALVFTVLSLIGLVLSLSGSGYSNRS